jgi:hypothetical protein
VEAHRAVRRRGSHIFYKISPNIKVRLSTLRAGRALLSLQYLNVARRMRLLKHFNDLTVKKSRDLSALTCLLRTSVLVFLRSVPRLLVTANVVPS